MSHGESHFKNRDKIVYFKAVLFILKIEPPTVRLRQPILWLFANKMANSAFYSYFTNQHFHKIGLK